MYRSTLRNLLITLLGAVLVSVTAVFASEASVLVLVASAVYLVIGLGLYKFDYLHPSVAYLLPWLMILIFSILPISRFARPIDFETYDVLLATVFAWLIGCAGAQPASSRKSPHLMPSKQVGLPMEFKSNFALLFALGFFALYFFAAVNIIFSGYIPLLSLLTTGDSRYLDFGLPSVYGAFLAYANAIGCLAYYVYLRTRRSPYLILFLSVFAVHVAFITRQNLVTLLVEAFVIRCLTIGRLSRISIIGCLALTLLGFSLLGSLRSGDAKELFGVQQEFMWVPTSIVWLYAYSYFNALNLDNTIMLSGAPFFDGFMWQTLLPSILRPSSNHELELYQEVSTAAASSYMYPVYMDIGKGVVAWTGALGLVTSVAYHRALHYQRFVDIATYSCLFFCALLSFFVDFWLYLPVIFQLFFFWLFHLTMFKRHPSTTSLAVA